jgi:D-3-phosphoglycerate dehydrogenase
MSRGARFQVVAAAAEVPSETLDIEATILGEVGAELLDRRGRPLDAIRDELASADAILTEALGRERFDADRIAQLDRCRVISVYAAGADGVDAVAASARGIVVANVPGYCAVDVAEHAVALLLAAWRKLPRAERVVRAGGWGLEPLRPVRRLAGCTVGLLGFGRIAREVAARLAPFDVRLLAHDPAGDPREAARLGVVDLCTLDVLLDESDVVSVHVPLTPQTRGLLDRRALGRLRPGAVVVNTSRGGVIDEDALLEALASGRVGAAALDVLSVEPPGADHPLLALEQVVVTPHMAYYSEDSLRDLRASVARNAALVLAGDRPSSEVVP